MLGHSCTLTIFLLYTSGQMLSHASFIIGQSAKLSCSCIHPMACTFQNRANAAAFVFLVTINCKVVRTDATVDTRKCSSLTQYSQVGLITSTSNSVQTSSKNNVSLDQF